MTGTIKICVGSMQADATARLIGVRAPKMPKTTARRCNTRVPPRFTTLFKSRLSDITVLKVYLAAFTVTFFTNE
jgi:hypothetical protein